MEPGRTPCPCPCPSFLSFFCSFLWSLSLPTAKYLVDYAMGSPLWDGRRPYTARIRVLSPAVMGSWPPRSLFLRARCSYCPVLFLLFLPILLRRNSPVFSCLGLHYQAPSFLSMVRCCLPIPYTHQLLRILWSCRIPHWWGFRGLIADNIYINIYIIYYICYMWRSSAFADYCLSSL
jgi:hypothetical protein